MSENTTRNIVRRPKDLEIQNTNSTAGNNYLLAIAINDYEHCPQLYNPVDDASALIEVLTEKYEFEGPNVKTLFNEEATEENIDKAFLQLAKEVTPADNVIIFFSGHGEYDKLREKGFWVPVNAHQGAYHEYISNSDIKDNLNAIKAKHTFMVVDSCFSGSLFATYKNVGGAMERLEKDPSRWGLTAGRTELVLDGEPGGNSPFADSLIYQLKNSIKGIGVAELCNKVIEAVISNAEQTPRGEPLKVKGHQGGQFYFHPRKDEAEVWGSVLQTNTKEAFEHYISLFPSGKHLVEAKAVIHELEEENVWQTALKNNTQASLSKYIRTYQNGKYYVEAIKKLKALEEENYWKSANIKSSYSAYLDYVMKFPAGKYLTQAKEKIAGFETSREQEQALLKEKKAWADKKAKTETDLTNKQSLFQTTIEAAEKLFKADKYLEAGDKFRESINYFQSDFVPDMAFIEKRLTACQQKSKIKQMMELGRDAYLKDNFDLAMQYFKKVEAIEPSKKIKDWIKQVEIKQFKQTVPPKKTPVKKQPPPAPPKKKKSGFVYKLIIGIVILLFVAGGIGLIVEEIERSNFSSTPYETIPPDKGGSEDSNTVYNPTTLAQKIIGTWKISNVYVNNSPDHLNTFLNTEWNFHQNGALVFVNTFNYRYDYAYGFNGDIISYSVGNVVQFSANIEISGNRMYWYSVDNMGNNYKYAFKRS